MYASSSISPVGEGFGHSFEKRSVSLTKWCFMLSLGKIWLWFWRTVYIQRSKQTELWFRWAKNLKAHTHTTWIYLHLMNLLKISEIHHYHFIINQNSIKRFIILLKFTRLHRFTLTSWIIVCDQGHKSLWLDYPVNEIRIQTHHAECVVPSITLC